MLESDSASPPVTGGSSEPDLSVQAGSIIRFPLRRRPMVRPGEDGTADGDPGPSAA